MHANICLPETAIMPAHIIATRKKYILFPVVYNCKFSPSCLVFESSMALDGGVSMSKGAQARGQDCPKHKIYSSQLLLLVCGPSLDPAGS